MLIEGLGNKISSKLIERQKHVLYSQQLQGLRPI